MTAKTSNPAHKSIRSLIQMLGVSVIAGGILAIMGPYGTQQAPLMWRIPYWIGLCFAGGLGAGLLDYFVEQTITSPSARQRALFQSIGATLFVLSILLSLRYINPNWANHTSLPMLIFFVWIISIVICSFGVLLDRRTENTSSALDRPALIERLKPALRSADIYALTSEDHYVRVITSAGEDLILMRLSDAVKETAPLFGLSTHRSWWVAEAGVKTVRRVDGKIVITLKNSLEAPVSRTGAKTVREAGWV